MKTSTSSVTVFTRSSGGTFTIFSDDAFTYARLLAVHEFCRNYFLGAGANTDKVMLIKMVRGYTDLELRDALCLVEDAQEEARTYQA
jgi:hypothetical protein